MIAETLLACWLIACVFVPLTLALTREPPVEVRRVTNALVRQRAEQVFRAERTETRWRRSVSPLADTLTAAAPVYAVEEVA